MTNDSSLQQQPELNQKDIPVIGLVSDGPSVLKPPDETTAYGFGNSTTGSSSIGVNNNGDDVEKNRHLPSCSTTTETAVTTTMLSHQRPTVTTSSNSIFAELLPVKMMKEVNENKRPREVNIKNEQEGVTTMKRKAPPVKLVDIATTTGSTATSTSKPPPKHHPQPVLKKKPFAPSIEEYLHQIEIGKKNDTAAPVVFKYLPRPEWCKSLNHLMRSQLQQVKHSYDFDLSNAVVTTYRDEYSEWLYKCVSHDRTAHMSESDQFFARFRMANRPYTRMMEEKDGNSHTSDTSTEAEYEYDLDPSEDMNGDASGASKNENNIVSAEYTQEKVDFLRLQLQSYVIYFDHEEYIWKTKAIDPKIGVDSADAYQMTYETLLQRRDINHKIDKDGNHTVLHMAIQKCATAVALDMIRMEYKTYRHGVKSDKDHDLSLYGVTMTMLETVNRRGMTPLIVAARMGNVSVVQALLRCGVEMCFSSGYGYTGPAMLQAAHYGRTRVIQYFIDFFHRHKEQSSVCDCWHLCELIETPNSKGTTPLMRAAQEGHVSAVQLLLKSNAEVDHQNNDGMTALMFAAQRGHVDICQFLIDNSADLNLKTKSYSTALLMACKRGHVAVVKLLVVAGCELFHLDHEDNTARQVIQLRIQRRHEALEDSPLDPLSNESASFGPEDSDGGAEFDCEDIHQVSMGADESILLMLHSQTQHQLLQNSMRIQRSYMLIRIHALLQDNRANIKFEDGNTYSVPTVVQWLEKSMINTTASTLELAMPHLPSKQAGLPQPEPQGFALPLLFNRPCTQMMLRMMLLPAPLVKAIALYIPLPNFWEQQIDRLLNYEEPNKAIGHALDLIDEILESGGFLLACDAAEIPAPIPHASWCDWKRLSAKEQTVWSDNVPVGSSRNFLPNNPQRQNVLTSKPPSPQDDTNPTIRELRRLVGYTSLLRQYQSQTNIVNILSGKPYDMPVSIVYQLIQLADIASICRRCCIEQFHPLSLESDYTPAIHFERNVVYDIVNLVRRLQVWHQAHNNKPT